MAEEVRGDQFEGREPFRERPAEPRVFYMGDHGPFSGEAPARSDGDIKRDVETALFYDEAVSSLGVQVLVQDGIVSLEGTVNSEMAKRLACEDAWKVGGVRDVRCNLQVHETPTPSRAAGQDVVAAKPPEPGYGIPMGQQGPVPRQEPGIGPRAAEQAGQTPQQPPSGPARTQARQG